ncbi:MAG: hypothetical protein M1834_008257 [Cirrosporium novae-zelandiae]|nr:MAG: hypothetical protein M1834_008257 [Cirrosporium novae-zelandiae]
MASLDSTQPTSSDVATTHPFTCNSCQVAFRASESQRAHMRSDWHRYNLKRRVASLPPLSSQVFAEKVLSAQANSSAAAAKASFEKSCQACQKTYFSENAYQNHLGSQKHKARLLALQNGQHKDETASVLSSTFSLGEPIEIAPSNIADAEAEREFSKVINGLKDTSLDEKEPFSRRPTRPHHSATEDRPGHPLSRTSTEKSDSKEAVDSTETSSTAKPEAPILKCLFCNYDSPTFKLNVQHMGKFHGLFIPEQEYLVDLPGLIKFLHRKINKYSQCLYCNKIKSNTAAVQTHMKDKSHCMIAFDSEDQMLEIGEFYDFSSTYSASEDEDSDMEMTSPTADTGSGGVKLGSGSKKSKVTVNNEDGDGDIEFNEDEANADGWETDSSFSSVDTDELTSVPIDDHSHLYERFHLNRHHSRLDARPHKNADGFHSHAHSSHHAVYYDDYELHLPSGRTAGHRSLARYYRQNLRNRPTQEERLQRMAIEEREVAAAAKGYNPMSEPESPDLPRTREGEQEDTDEKNKNTSKALVTKHRDEMGMIGVSDSKKSEVKATERRERRRAHRQEAKYRQGLDKRNNNQRFYADPLGPS